MQNSKVLSLLTIALVACLTIGHAAVEEQVSEAEVQLREQLRSTLVQLRDAQGKIAVLEGTQLQDQRKIQGLEKELEKLRKESSEESAAAEARITELQSTMAAQDERNAKQVEAIAKWKKSFDELTAVARATEAKRAELAAKIIVLERTVAAQAETNRKLYEVGKEILDRYEGFGLGDAVLAREPFVGTTRVKFQNLVQDLGDQLTNNRIKE